MSLPRFFSAVLLALVCLIPCSAHAASTVTPLTDSVSAFPRETIQKTLTLNNPTDFAEFYRPFVYEVDPVTKALTFIESQSTDLEKSPSHWVQISRSEIKLPPHSHTAVPYQVIINPHATAGVYHAVIRIAQGDTFGTAEQASKERSALSVDLTITVADDSIYNANLKSFTASQTMFTGDTFDATAEFMNTGNQDLVITGALTINDNKGMYITDIPFTEPLTIPPHTSKGTTLTWHHPGKFGKFKVRLSAGYEHNGFNSHIEDVLFYYSVPKKLLIGSGFTVGVLFLCIFLYHYRKALKLV